MGGFGKFWDQTFMGIIRGPIYLSPFLLIDLKNFWWSLWLRRWWNTRLPEVPPVWNPYKLTSNFILLKSLMHTSNTEIWNYGQLENAATSLRINIPTQISTITSIDISVPSLQLGLRALVRFRSLMSSHDGLGLFVNHCQWYVLTVSPWFCWSTAQSAVAESMDVPVSTRDKRQGCFPFEGESLPGTWSPRTQILPKALGNDLLGINRQTGSNLEDVIDSHVLGNTVRL